MEDDAPGLLAKARQRQQQGLCCPVDGVVASSAAAILAKSALDLYRQQGDGRGAQVALAQLVRAKLATEKAEDVHEALLLAADEAKAMRNTGDKQGEGSAMLLQSEVHAAMQEHREALKAAGAAQALFAQVGDATWGARAMIAASKAELARGEIGSAVRAAEQALTLAQRAGDESLLAEAWLAVLGANQNEQGSTARQAGKRAAKLYGKLGDTAGQAAAMLSVSRVQLAQGHLDSALDGAQEALVLFLELKQRTGAVQTMEVLVQASMQLGELDTALQTVLDLDRHFVTTGDIRGHGAASEQLAYIYLIAEQGGAALRSCRTALESYRSVHNKLGTARMLHLAGEAELGLEQYGSAYEMAHEAVMLFAQLDHAQEEAAARTLTSICIAMGEPEKAPHRPEALELLRECARAVECRDAEAFRAADENLKELEELLTDEDMVEIMAPVLKRNPKRAAQFIKENTARAQDDGTSEDTGGSFAVACVDNDAFDTSFSPRGIQYEPKIPYVDTAYGVRKDDPLAESLAVSMGIVAGEWEKGLVSTPCILDGLLQSQSAGLAFRQC